MDFNIAFIVSICFFFILILSIFSEIPFFESFFSRFPTLVPFIPNWSFFAPIPGMHDYTLKFRYIQKDKKSTSNWIAIQSNQENRSFFSFFWNPKKKFSKALFDVINDLIRFNTEIQDFNQLRISIPYLQLLNFINWQKHPLPEEYIQFMVSSHSRLFKEEVVFQSDIHPIKKEIL